MNPALAPVLACLVTQPRRRQDGPPPLYLAPMEGLGDRAFRRALVLTVGGVDQACTEFIRIPGVAPPTEAHMVKAASRLTTAAYSSAELGTVPLAAQIMGSDPAFLAAATAHLAGSLGCRRVDLNCGCPANTVTGRGAGSSLLQTPGHLAACVSAMAAAAQAHGAQVSVKLRAGFDDTSLLEENLRAAVDAGAQLITLHPRTRKQGYSGAADWSLVGRAVALLSPGTPVIGNGDVVTAAKAQQLHLQTGCHGIMVGRGAAQDPLIFHRIRQAFSGAPSPVAASEEAALVELFLRSYYEELACLPEPKRVKATGGRTSADLSRFRTGKLKQLGNYLLRAHSSMQSTLVSLLHATPEGDSDVLLELMVACIREHWRGPPTEAGLVDTFSSRNQYSAPSPAPGAALAGC
jgi:tRNA-dihydrouridine synthase C